MQDVFKKRNSLLNNWTKVLEVSHKVW